MTSTITTDQKVDVGALALEIRMEVTDRIGSMVTEIFNVLEEKEQSLNQVQQSEVISSVTFFTDGLERAIAKSIVKELQHRGIAVWGLPDSLADLADDDA